LTELAALQQRMQFKENLAALANSPRIAHEFKNALATNFRLRADDPVESSETEALDLR